MYMFYMMCFLQVAVNNVSVSMYEGQIFALLGHNGAGMFSKVVTCMRAKIRKMSKSTIPLYLLVFFNCDVSGKSTLLNMLTGILPITSGQSSIYGFDLGSDLSNIRKLFGTWYVIILWVVY